MSELVLLQRHGAVAEVTLNNPRTRNALSRDVLHALADILESLEEDTQCRVIILTGANGHFCSGGDISGMTAERPLPIGRSRMLLGHRVVRAMLRGSKPVIAAVEGYAAGAGLSLVAAADYVIAAPGARFVSSFAKVGLVPDLGLLWTLPQRIGIAQARRMFYSARVVDDQEALKIGIVDSLADSVESMHREALDLAEAFKANAPLSVALTRMAMARGINCLEDALAYEVDNQSALYLTQDHREAVDAFVNKRPAEFKGL
ncbi:MULTISPECIES: enoyl-CoA hydratase/isomerase family protein [unclassified Pseudomonas]|uniref:enoyl-CoA hydratase/isomerase family protein n=1 Tax=unclassified Pseudomonas TaxID=196821 RepID=UPI0025E71EEE|nr:MULTISPECIES: enoyl-CoA hydratase/isomerase family protein [unclassified Pseudomonas]